MGFNSASKGLKRKTVSYLFVVTLSPLDSTDYGAYGLLYQYKAERVFVCF
jgi:hypothetical protein